ncbi:Uu.00g118780.m01.CDS01 [Anthostomella pinea]|uniref:Uu.00g118780.m01.CDS01 n=1 Tax=Anthostomella pinea TaxID=933095 RepID=A0AAI8YH20_9PEZI|nr:Uu.00g118780.m01.CDS01 [Anthostomella pinea]
MSGYDESTAFDNVGLFVFDLEADFKDPRDSTNSKLADLIQYAEDAFEIKCNYEPIARNTDWMKKADIKFIDRLRQFHEVQSAKDQSTKDQPTEDQPIEKQPTEDQPTKNKPIPFSTYGKEALEKWVEDAHRYNLEAYSIKGGMDYETFDEQVVKTIKRLFKE